MQTSRIMHETKAERSDLEREPGANQYFVPFSDRFLHHEAEIPGELVPFSLNYNCVRLLDGTYEFSPS